MYASKSSPPSLAIRELTWPRNDNKNLAQSRHPPTIVLKAGPSPSPVILPSTSQGLSTSSYHPLLNHYLNHHKTSSRLHQDIFIQHPSQPTATIYHKHPSPIITMSANPLENCSEADLKRFAACWLNSDRSEVNHAATLGTSDDLLTR